MTLNIRILTSILLVTSMGSAVSQPLDEEEEFALAFGDEDFISIATGSRQLIAKAPAVATVITAEEIKKMGAKNLDEVLETVPGLHVSLSSVRFGPIYSIRGIYTDFNPQVLMLINGVPITQVFTGDRGTRSTIPINNISRVEIIRGPGSAVYGADAFSGVINVITKKSDEIDGLVFGVRTGSFSTKHGWVQHGGEWSGYEMALSIEWSDTDGDNNRIIDTDLQSAFDAGFGTSSSFSPGPADTRQERVDTRIDISKDKWRLNFWNWRQFNLGVGPGLASALDPSGRVDANNYMANLYVNDIDFSKDWEGAAKFSYMDINTSSRQKLFPPETLLPIGLDGNINPVVPSGLILFTDGFIGNPEVYEQHTRLDLSAYFTGHDDHRIRVGIGYARAELEAKETKNFGPGVIDGSSLLAPPSINVIDGTLTGVTDTSFIFIKNENRTLFYISLQDEWSFAPDWDLTAGVRYDDYTDFGDTVNPRLALVWQTFYNLTSKLLYGRAFRAPSFQELYNINNPVAIGNPNLDPETIDTLELAFDFQNIEGFHSSLNLFQYDMNDIIRFVPDVSGASIAQNTGAQTGYGFEVEASMKISSKVSFSGNYAWQDSSDEDADSDTANTPGQQIYIRTDWGFIRDWNLNAQVNWVTDRKRAALDTRNVVDDFTTVDITLRYNPGNSSWEFAISGHNIFDEDVLEPSPFSLPSAAIPNDFPLPEQNIFAEIIYNL